MTRADGDQGATRPYAQSAPVYRDAGWQGVLPLPARQKAHPPIGWTGHNGGWPSTADILAWVEGREGDGNVALRLPPGVIGLDVDAYGGKQGAATFADAVTRWGPLPATWRSTNRPDGQGSILLFRVPPGLAWPGELGPGVELIQFAHRYMVVWPSIHPEGRTYRWVPLNGSGAAVPRVAELPYLPWSWVAGLTGGQAAGEPLPHAGLGSEQVTDWLAQHGGGQPCRDMLRATGDYGPARFADGSSRHETARAATRRITALAAEGHTGMSVALAQVEVSFTDSIKGDKNRPSDPHEWRRMVNGAVQIAAAKPVADHDPCLVPAVPQQPQLAEATRRIIATRASGIYAKVVPWGWADRLQAAALSIAAGREGTGKSSFTIWLAAQLTRGTLPGINLGTPVPVGITASEDSWEHIIVPRLLAAGADRELVYRLDITEGSTDGLPLVLPADVKALRATITELGLKALIIDPLMSNIDGSLNTNNSREARKALDPLNTLAIQARVMVVGICHFNKNTGSDISSLISGSGAFKDVPRSVLGFVRDENTGERFMQQTKNSAGRDDLPTLAYKLDPLPVSVGDGESTTTVRFLFDGESARSAKDVLRDARLDGDSSERQANRSAAAACTDWLRQWMTNHSGSGVGSDIKAEARAQEHEWGRKVWRTAIDRLGIDTTQKTKEEHSRNIWTMFVPPVPQAPESAPPEHCGPHCGPTPDSGEGNSAEGHSAEPPETLGSEALSEHCGPTAEGDRKTEGHSAPGEAIACTICGITDPPLLFDWGDHGGWRCRQHAPGADTTTKEDDL